MRVFVNVKQIGKKRNAVQKIEYELADIKTVGGLIREIVTVEVERFNERADDKRIIEYLTKEEIGDHVDVGKIGFNRDYNKSMQDLEKAVDNALL